MKYIHDVIGCSEKKKILEVGAGTGRYSIALAQEGHQVDALEYPYEGVSYEEYERVVLPELMMHEKPINMPDWFVPETYYYLWDGDKLVGEYRMRHYLSEGLKVDAGHIGYSIKKQHSVF